jgi:predicted amidohydrolase YtcJ
LFLALIALACGGELRDEVPTSEPAPAGADAADAVYTNGRVYTVDADQPWAEAVAIKDGKFLVVGSNSEVEPVAGPATDVVDLAGSFVMPGLVDIHIHPSMSMIFRVFCELPGTFYAPTEEQTIAALKDCIAAYPADQEWFFAEGYSTPVMSEETLSREFLDALIPDRPAYIKDESGHFAWANSRAFELLDIDRNTPDTPEGFFSRGPDGEPAGQVFESAMNPFEDAILPLSPEVARLAKTKLLEQATAQGVTAIGDAYVFERDLPDWQVLKREGALDAHVVLYHKGNLGTAELTPVETIAGCYDAYDLPGHPGVKVSMGGAIQSYTEVMVGDGYADGRRVEPLIPIEALSEYARALDRAGIQIKVHAIGDGTVRATIDGFEPAITGRGENALRHHIDHCTFVRPDDMARMRDLGIPCSAWPMLNAPSGYVMDQARYLKPEVFHEGSPNRALIDAGVMVANHSDAPQANLWPWWGMEATVTRGFPGNPETPPLGAHQAITLEEAIQVHTLNAAWVLRLDDLTGSIEAGKSADMIVLNHDLFEIPETEIHKTKVQKTIFQGQPVYVQ